MFLGTKIRRKHDPFAQRRHRSQGRAERKMSMTKAVEFQAARKWHLKLPEMRPLGLKADVSREGHG